MIDANMLRVISETYPQERKQIREETRKAARVVFSNAWEEEKKRGERELASLVSTLLDAARDGKDSYTLPVYARDLRHLDHNGYSDNPIQGTEQDLVGAYKYAVSDHDPKFSQEWRNKYHTPIIVTKGLLSSLGPAKRLIHDRLVAQGFSIALQFTTSEYMEMVISW